MDKQNFLKKTLNYIVTFYFLISITFLPLFFHDKYFDILMTKANVFIYITGITAVIFILFNIAGVLLNQDCIKFPTNFTDKMIVLFLTIAFASTLYSEDKAEAMWGTAGWRVGTSFFILCGAAYYMLSRNFEWKDIFAGALVLVNEIVLLLGIANAVGVDPLKMNDEIAKADYGKYLSTIGNVNWYAGYLCIVLSLSVMVFIMSEHLIARTISSIVVMSSIINGIACNSDSFFLGMIPVGIYILYCTLQSKDELRKLIELITIWLVAIIITVTLKKRFIVSLDYIQNLLSSYVGGTAILLMLAVMIILYKADRKEIYKNSKKIVSGILIMIVILIITILIRANLFPYSGSNIFVSKFKLNGAWGTKRGYIWEYTLKMYIRLRPMQKLIGVGTDTFGIAFRKYYLDEMLSIWNKDVINAHCEPLQILITNGILGVIAYYGIFISAIKTFIRKNNIVLKAIAVALISYLCQGLVNNIQGVCMPFVFIMIGVGMSIVFRDNSEEL